MPPYEKRKNRSDKYQYVLLETVCSHEMLDSFSNEESIYFRLNPFDYNDRLMDLKERLKERLWELINEQLTPRQAEVIRLYIKEELTQMEIAKKLRVNQSSITKSLNGNVDYKNGKKSYGGALRKIGKIAEADEEVNELLAKIREMQDIW
jgi:predicted DNA-binding protein YlxM (UPF0122 family)